MVFKFFKKIIPLNLKKYYWRYQKKRQKAAKRRVKFDTMTPKEAFTYIYNTNYWSGRESISDFRKDVYEQKVLPIWAPTLTRMFRNRDFSGKIPDAPGLDTIMLLYQAQFGKIKFIDEVTGVYRLHEGGVHSSNSVAEKKKRIFLTNLHSLELVPHYLMKRYFGMLLKKLTELRYLDLEEFSSCHDIFKCAFKKYHSELSFFLKLKIKLSLFLIKLPLLERIKILKTLILKFLNYSFIKMTYLKIGFL